MLLDFAADVISILSIFLKCNEYRLYAQTLGIFRALGLITPDLNFTAFKRLLNPNSILHVLL